MPGNEAEANGGDGEGLHALTVDHESTKRRKHEKMLNGEASRDSWNRWIVAVAVVAVTLFACYLAVLQLRVWANREQRRQKISVAVMSIANYSDIYKRCPPNTMHDATGKPLRSWRLELVVAGCLPEPSAMTDKDQPWNAAVNAPVTSVATFPYCFGILGTERSLNTNIMAFVGDDSALASATRLNELPHDLIVLIEVDESITPWAAPGDLELDDLPESPTGGCDGQGVHVAFADQTVWYLRRDVPISSLLKFARVADADRYDRDDELAAYVVDW